MIYDVMYNLHEEKQMEHVFRYPVVSKKNPLCDDIFTKVFSAKYRGYRLRQTRPEVGPLTKFPTFSFWAADFMAKSRNADGVFAVSLLKR